MTWRQLWPWFSGKPELEPDDQFMIFEPRRDITAYELAVIMKSGGHGQFGIRAIIESAKNPIALEFRRHYREARKEETLTYFSIPSPAQSRVPEV